MGGRAILDDCTNQYTKKHPLRFFIIEEVKTTTNKFEDILRCFNWFWSNMNEQCFCLCVEVELCFPWNKTHQKHVRIKATPIWHFNSFINNPLWKAARRQARFLAPPSEQVKDDIVDLKLSGTSFPYKWR